MKYVFGLLVMFLVGCSPSAEQKEFAVLPEELKDCKFYRLRDGSGTSLTIARCPNSQTAVKLNDKQGNTSIVINGKEYVPK